MKFKLILIFLVCCALAGCATTPPTATSSGYMTGKVEDTWLSDMDDTRAIDLFKRVHSQPVTTKEDSVAKEITVSAFIKALSSRRSPEIRDSGILRSEHTKVDLRKWTDDEVVEFYNKMYKELHIPERSGSGKRPPEKTALWASATYEAPTGGEEKDDPTGALPEEEASALSIIRFTGLYSAGSEIARREQHTGGWSAVKDISMTTATVAAQIALTLAKFLI
jgi:hypothetical protein